MDYQELKEKSVAELQTLLVEKRQALQELRIQAQERQLKNVRAVRTARAVVARILTALQARRQARS